MTMNKVEALRIGREYCKGEILQEECILCQFASPYPNFYQIIIHHEDDDQNIYKSTLHVLPHNGVVIFWEKEVIQYGEVD